MKSKQPRSIKKGNTDNIFIQNLLKKTNYKLNKNSNVLTSQDKPNNVDVIANKRKRSPKHYTLKRTNSLIYKQNDKNKKIFDHYYSNVESSVHKESAFSRHFVPLNKQWKSGIYFYDKNNLSLTAVKQQIIDKLTKAYFNLIPLTKKNVTKSKRMRDFLRRSSIKNIYISSSEIKETNDKLYVTLYIYDRTKKHFIKKLYFSNKSLKKTVYSTKLGINKIKGINSIKSVKIYNRKINNIINYKNSIFNKTKKNFMPKMNYRFLLYKRRKLIRKNYIQQSRFSQLRLFNIKRNVFKKYISNFSFRFWIWLSKCLNISFVIYRNKLILKWPKSYNIISSDLYKSDGINKLEIFALNKYIQNALMQYKLFNVFNVVPSDEINKIILNMSSKKNITAKNSIKSLNKSRLLKLIVFYLTKRLITSSLTNLYGKSATKLITSTLWKRRFTEYYNEYLGKKIQKYIFNFNKLFFEKDLFFYRRNKYMPVIKNILENFYNKKALLNIVNMKYIHLNSDNYMDAIRKKLKKRTSKLLKVLRKSLKLVKLPKKLDFSSNNLTKFSLSDKINYKYMNNTNSSKKIINKTSYKYVTGVRLEAKGRLTKRYTASRALFKFRYKGNLKNLEYSKTHPNELKKSPHLELLRGDLKPNIQRTFISGTKRIGVFGLKGWISGN